MPLCSPPPSSPMPGFPRGLPSALVLTIAVLVAAARGCSPIQGPEPTMYERIVQSRVVWHGKIVRRYPDRIYQQGYTAEMSIHCIIKGPSVPKVYNITHAGSIPGHCHTTNLEVGKNYIVTLYPSTGMYNIDGAEIAATDDNLDKVYTACEIKPTYPQGSSEATAEVKCKAPITPCEGLTPVVVANATGPPEEAVPEIPKDGNHYHGDGHDHPEHFPGDGHGHGTAATPHDNIKDDHDHTKDHDHHEGDGHNHDDHHEGDHDHHEGDGHDHDAHHHDNDGHDKEVNNVKPVSGESTENGAAHTSHSLALLVVLSTVMFRFFSIPS